MLICIKEMKHYEIDLEFQWVYQGFKKNGLFMVKIDIKIFIQGINV